jgi:hypothetical protein
MRVAVQAGRSASADRGVSQTSYSEEGPFRQARGGASAAGDGPGGCQAGRCQIEGPAYRRGEGAGGRSAGEVLHCPQGALEGRDARKNSASQYDDLDVFSPNR